MIIDESCDSFIPLDDGKGFVRDNWRARGRAKMAEVLNDG